MRSSRADRGEHLHNVDPVRRYLDEIGAIPLLTAAQEVDLAKRIEAGVYAAELLRQEADDRRDLGTKSREDLAAVAEDGRWAKDRMIRANLRLVVAVASRHPRRGLPLLDAIQEGNLGLIRAVEKFDYTKGYKFSTYATWWIRQALARGCAQHYHTFRLPLHVVEELNRLELLDRELAVRLGRRPSLEELAAASGTPAARISELRRAERDPLNLDAPLDHDAQLTLADVVADAEAIDIVEIVARRSLATAVHDAVASLPPREALVIRQRYGLDNGRSHTLQEIGEEIGVSRERVRQLQRHGLTMLRETRRSRMLLPWTG